MIQVESITLHGNVFKRTYSDAGFLLRKIGTDELYAEAVDLPDAPYEYEETDIPIDSETKQKGV